MSSCDVLIAGGGLVGLSLALALRPAGLRVLLVDRPPVWAAGSAADQRHLALSEASCRVLEDLGVMSRLVGTAEPILGVHVSSQGEFGVARWSAAERGMPRFGMVVPARRLLAEMWSLVSASAEIEVRAPAVVAAAAAGADSVRVSVEGEGSVGEHFARLLVIADGAESRLREQAGIPVERHDYQCQAICSSLRPARAHEGVAYERFTRGGPLALLPQPGGRCGVVQVLAEDEVAARMALTDKAFLAALQKDFGYRLGPLLDLGPRLAYPLRRVYATRLHGARQVLVGNAAQTLHPVGAQGFNLGLRDVAALATRLCGAARDRRDPGDASLLADYAAVRAADRSATAGMSHLLAQATTLRSPAASLLRSTALLAADRLGPLREYLQLAGMGFRPVADPKSDRLPAPRSRTHAIPFTA